jgi:hypothetical protein
MVRGVAADQWQACYRSDSARKSSKITISFSSDNWVEPGMANAPLEVRVESKEDAADAVKLDVFTITQFRPFLTLQEEGYFVIINQTPPTIS